MQAPIIGGGGDFPLPQFFVAADFFFVSIFDGVQTAELGQGSD